MPKLDLKKANDYTPNDGEFQYEDEADAQPGGNPATAPQDEIRVALRLRPQMDRLDSKTAQSIAEQVNELNDISAIVGATKKLIKHKISHTRKRLRDALLIKKVRIPAVEQGAYRTLLNPSVVHRPTLLAKLIKWNIPLYAAGFALGLTATTAVSRAKANPENLETDPWVSVYNNYNAVRTFPYMQPELDEEPCQNGSCYSSFAEPQEYRNTPTAELCDGIDNNHDGRVDEEFYVGSTCIVGVGSCARTGINICAGNGSVTCSARPGSPSPEVCDGIDNDCDGRADDGINCAGNFDNEAFRP